MDLTLNQEQDLIRSSARKLLDAHCPTAHVRAMQQDERGYSPELWRRMAETGWMGLALPEQHGGVGLGFLELCLIVEEQGRVLLPSPFVPTAMLAALTIARFGTEEQQAARLPAIASGNRILTCCGAGPGGPWDPQHTNVVARPSGEGFRLEGSARFVPYAHVADELLVVARREGAAAGELTVFLVDARAEGISTDPLGTIALEPRHRVTLQDVPASEGGVLGGVDRGLPVARTVGDWAAAAACAAMVGAAQHVLEMTVDYATERQQFGRPIGSFQAVQHHCADMAADVLTSRLMTFDAVWRLSEGLDDSEPVSMAKAWVGEAGRRVCALGHQVHGAIGFTREHDLHLFTRHVHAAALDSGDEGHHRERVAQRLGL